MPPRAAGSGAVLPPAARSGAVPPRAATPGESCTVPQNDAGAVARCDPGAETRGDPGAAARGDPGAAARGVVGGVVRGDPGATVDGPSGAAVQGSRADGGPGPAAPPAEGATGKLSFQAPRGAVTTTGSVTGAAASECPQESLADAGGPARRARADVAAAKLVEIGIDPMIVDKLRVDARTLSASADRPVALVEALEHAMRDFRPTGPRLKIRTLRVVTTCADCGCSLTPSVYGLLPLDGLDAEQLQQSGRAIVLTSREAASPEKPGSARSDRAGLAGKDIPHSLVADSPTRNGVLRRDCGTTRARMESPRSRIDAAQAQAASSVGDSAAGHSAIGSARKLTALQSRFVLARQGSRCAVRGCLGELADEHHLDAFAVERKSDPDRVFLICREHHDAVHAGLIANPGESPDRWRVRQRWIEGEVGDQRLAEVNRQVQRHRGKPARQDAGLARRMAPEAGLTLDAEPSRAEDDQDGWSPEGLDDA